MELLQVVELFTTAVSLLLMASGIPACLKMVQTKNTHNVPFILFLVSAMNSTFGLCYGSLVDNSTFILINGVGLVVWSAYIVVYIGVSKSKSWPLSQLLMLVMALLGHGFYLKVAAPFPPALTNTLGSFLLVWSVVLLLTPVLDIIAMVQQGSSAGSDMFLLFGGTLCCAAWLFYGYLLNDVFVYVRPVYLSYNPFSALVRDALVAKGCILCAQGPNVMGLGVNGIKMATIAAYSGSPKKQKSKKTN